MKEALVRDGLNVESDSILQPPVGMFQFLTMEWMVAKHIAICLA